MTTFHNKQHKDTDVAGVEIIFSVVYFFPLNLNGKFPNLRAISIINSKMREIHKSDLEKFPELEFLSLRGNDIQVLEPKLFFNNPKLAVLSFNHNNIEHVDPQSFDGLKNLVTLQMALNPCLGHSRSIRKNPQNVIEEVIERCKPRVDNSTNWKRQEVMEEDTSCECGELTMSTLLLAIVAVTAAIYIFVDKIGKWRQRKSGRSGENVDNMVLMVKCDTE